MTVIGRAASSRSALFDKACKFAKCVAPEVYLALFERWIGIPAPVSSLYVRIEKRPDNRANLGAMGLKCQVSSVVKPDVSPRDVALPCSGTRWEEEGVVLPPNSQQRWLM